MRSNTNNSLVVVLLALVTILLTNVNAKNNSSIPPPPPPPTPLPSSPPPILTPPIQPLAPSDSPISPPEESPDARPPPRARVRISFRQPTVTGIVYCNCPRYGRPFYGAKVRLSCRRFRFLKKTKTVTTSFSGRFYVTLPWWAKKSSCKVTLKQAPRSSRCRFKSNLNRGISGATLRGGYRNLYTVGPFSFTSSPFINCYT